MEQLKSQFILPLSNLFFVCQIPCYDKLGTSLIEECMKYIYNE